LSSSSTLRGSSALAEQSNEHTTIVIEKKSGNKRAGFHYMGFLRSEAATATDVKGLMSFFITNYCKKSSVGRQAAEVGLTIIRP
jgi:hypothetical protein